MHAFTACAIWLVEDIGWDLYRLCLGGMLSLVTCQEKAQAFTSVGGSLLRSSALMTMPNVPCPRQPAAGAKEDQVGAMTRLILWVLKAKGVCMRLKHVFSVDTQTWVRAVSSRHDTAM